MRTKIWISAGLGLSLVLGVVPASMAAGRFYMGGSVGQSKAHFSSGEVATDLNRQLSGQGVGGFGASDVSVDNTDTGWKGFAGFRLTPNFAIEGGYVDLGTASATANSGGTVPVTRDFKNKHAVYLDALVGLVPLDRFAVFGRVGAYNMKAESVVNASGSLGGVPVSASNTTSKSSTDLHFGGGVGFAVTNNMGVRVEWERFKNVGSQDETGRTNWDLASVGVVFGF